MNIKIQDAEEYIPYGEDWEKEMMKLPKKFLIEQLKNQWQQSQQPEIDKDKLLNELRAEIKVREETILQWQYEYSKLQSQQPKEADGWISVEDDVPSENKEVLAIETDAFGDMDRIIAQWTGEYWYSPFKARKVTHWQPLPLTPKK